MRRLILSLAVTVVSAVAGQSIAWAATSQFDEDRIPANPQNTFSAFGFGAFNIGTTVLDDVVVDGVSAIEIDAADFGGVGVDYGDNPGAFVFDNYDAALSVVEVRVKVLAGNVASVFRTTFNDDDGDDGGTSNIGRGGTEYVYEWDISGQTEADGFVLHSVPMSGFLFSQQAFDHSAGDGVQNPGLKQMQVQSLFGSTDRLHIALDFYRVEGIPEPATLGLACVGILGLAGCRRRAR